MSLKSLTLNRHPWISVLGVLILVAATFAITAPARATTYVVNTLWDDYDGECDATHCSLREAILEANEHPGPDTIWINIESGSPNWVIYIHGDLPSITDDHTTIDATTMPEFLGGPSVVIVGDDASSHAFYIESNNNTIRGFKFSNFRSGLYNAPIVVHGDGNLIEGNAFNNSEIGILVMSDDNIIRDNDIGVTPWGSASPNDVAGVYITGVGNLIEENRIAYNGGDGIEVSDYETPTRNTLARNSIFDNVGLGINLHGHSSEIEAPLLTDVGLTEISGEACRGCTVELFLAAPDPTEYGEGVTFLGSAEADAARTFTLTLDAPLETCDQVTATATDEFGTTSEFALNGRAGMCSTYAMPPIVEPYLTVNTTSNYDDGVCNEEHCSLREAILYANRTVGGDTISFDIDGLVPHQIVLTLPLPRLTDDRTFIDGTSEPDYAGSPVVWLVSDEENIGLYIDSQRNTIRGLGLIGFGGVDDSAGWPEATGGGIYLYGGLNQIQDNLIAEGGYGIYVASNHNTITGNMIGVNAAGASAASNGWDGIIVTGHDNQIGEAGDGNIISGNGRYGINVYNTSGNIVMGNIIGADASGTTAIPNASAGIFTQGETTIGGLGSGEGNLIASNGGDGILLYDTARHAYIAGNTVRENTRFGILVDSMGSGDDTFTQNSIYDNGILGIETNRSDDHVPVLESASLTSVSGVVPSCRGCIVEVFEAAPDPSGYGEGQTYLGEVRTDVGGNFTFEFSGVSICDELTATATDGDGETSEFSENVLVACFRAPARPMAAVGFGGVLVLTILVVILRELRPETPPWLRPGVAGVSGLLLVALIFGAAAVMPDVQLDFSAARVPPPDPLPYCSEFLDPAGFTTGDDAVFTLDTDPQMGWTPGADAPTDAVWMVELRTPDQKLRSLTTSDLSMSLSAFQLDPRAGGRYDWTVRMLENGEPACRPDARHTFRFENPALQMEAMLPETEAEPVEEEPTEEACTPLVTAAMNANCRYGPGSVYAELAYLLEGESADILGVSADAAWWYIQLADTQQVCWVWDGAVEAACTAGLAVIAAPPTPTPPPDIDETPPAVPSPVAPVGGQVLGCTGSVLLNWTAVTDPSGIDAYTVEVQRSSDNATWSAASGSPFTTALNKQPLTVECGWYYRWRVRATDGEGNASAWSGWAAFSVTLE